MSPTSSFNSPQQPHQHDGYSSEFYAKLSNLHDDGEVSVLFTNQQALPNTADPACPETLCPLDSSTHASCDPREWKRLLSSPFATHERISLVTALVSNRDEVDMARRLCGDDAQNFVDLIYEARSHVVPSPKSRLPDSDPNFYASPIRRLMALIRQRGWVVCGFYARFVAPMPCFQNHWPSKSSMTE